MKGITIMAKTKPQLVADTEQTLKPDAEPDKAVERNPKPAEFMSQAESEQLDEEEKEFRALRRDLPGVKGTSATGIVAISVGKTPSKNEFFRTHSFDRSFRLWTLKSEWSGNSSR
jgi:hypothetical protein